MWGLPTVPASTKRRKHLAVEFEHPKSMLLPRQQYGIDFYGHANGNILVVYRSVYPRSRSLVHQIQKSGRSSQVPTHGPDLPERHPSLLPQRCLDLKSERLRFSRNKRKVRNGTASPLPDRFVNDGLVGGFDVALALKPSTSHLMGCHGSDPPRPSCGLSDRYRIHR